MYELVKPGGIAVGSVPIELGPALLLKELAARAINYKRTINTEGTWTTKEIIKAALWDIAEVKRERVTAGRRTHKGFDFRDVGKVFFETFEDVRMRGTPFPMFGPHFNVGVVYAGIRKA